MTKSLTEQWKNGELKFGKTYWCSDDEGNVAKLVLVSKDRFYEWTLGTEVTKDVKEVLAPVPSYDEYKRLQEQLKEANEVIEKYMALGNWYDFYNEGPSMVADDMQKYIEKWGVK